MTLKISADSPLTNHYLFVQSDGVKFCQESASVAPRHFRYADIECILISPEHKLSFQVGQEVFSIPTDPSSEEHDTVIATLVYEVQRAVAGWAPEAEP